MFNCQQIQPPNQKAKILRNILLLLMLFSLIQSFLLAINHQVQAICYFMSALLSFITQRQLSYYGCFINQIFYFVLVWVLLLQMANHIGTGLYQLYLSFEGIYKISTLVICLINLYFNLAAYQCFKQFYKEIYYYQNNDNDENHLQNQ